jgi:saccharopine dehydrogenase-like NADP-dependent oxidoreductase
MKKRIFVLGGAGNMASEGTRDLLKAPDIGEVAIGEVNLEAAHRLAGELNDPRVKVIPVDVTDHADAVQKIQGYDVLMNGLYFGLFDHALTVACQAKVDYADLISEPTPEQYHQAKEAGITAISGLGLTPGLSNVLARHGANHLDQTEEIHIHGVSFRTSAPSQGLLDTILWELATPCPTRQYYFRGRFVPAAPFEGSKVVRFGDPVGEQVVYYVPHTETGSLPRHIRGVQYVSVRGTWRPRLMEDVRILNQYGLLDNDTVTVGNRQVRVRDFVRDRIWQTQGGKVDADLWTFFLNVEVIGRLGQETRRYIYDVTHPATWGERATAKMTGINASVGVILLARHGRTKVGLLDPEEYYDPGEFLAELAIRRDIKVMERLA